MEPQADPGEGGPPHSYCSLVPASRCKFRVITNATYIPISSVLGPGPKLTSNATLRPDGQNR